MRSRPTRDGDRTPTRPEPRAPPNSSSGNCARSARIRESAARSSRRRDPLPSGTGSRARAARSPRARARLPRSAGARNRGTPSPSSVRPANAYPRIRSVVSSVGGVPYNRPMRRGYHCPCGDRHGRPLRPRPSGGSRRSQASSDSTRVQRIEEAVGQVAGTDTRQQHRALAVGPSRETTPGVRRCPRSAPGGPSIATSRCA